MPQSAERLKRKPRRVQLRYGGSTLSMLQQLPDRNAPPRQIAEVLCRDVFFLLPTPCELSTEELWLVIACLARVAQAQERRKRRRR